MKSSRLLTLLLVATLGCASVRPVVHAAPDLARRRVPPPAVNNVPSLQMRTAPAIALGVLGAVVALIVILNWNGNEITPL
jgi:hypothetical protein